MALDISFGLIKYLVERLAKLLNDYLRRGKDGLTPREVVRRWNLALQDGDLDFVRSHTYLKTQESQQYVEQKWGSLNVLSKKYQTGPSSKAIFKSEYIDETSRDGATVTYDVYYEGGRKAVWQDFLVKDEGVWKVRPEFVIWKDEIPKRVPISFPDND